MKSALDVHGALLAAGVAHEMVRVRSAVLSADDLPRGLQVEASDCVAVRCYVATRPDGTEQFVAVMVRAGDTVDPACLLDATHAKAVRPATADETNVATDYAAPLVCPIGLSTGVLLLADATLGSTDVLYTATGESGVALGIRTHDLLVAADARVAALTQRPLESADFARPDLGDEPAGPGPQVIELSPQRPGTSGRAGRPARRAR